MKKVKVELDYDIGDRVYLVTDPDQYERIVVSIQLLPAGLPVYCVACGDTQSEHYAIEMSLTARVE